MEQAGYWKGVTLKAEQDERTIASFWDMWYPFSFASTVCFVFVWLYWVLSPDFFTLPNYQITIQYRWVMRLRSVMWIWWKFHTFSKKNPSKTQPSIYLTLVHIPEEKGYFSHMSIVALWQVRHEDSVFCFFLVCFCNFEIIVVLCISSPLPSSILHSGCCHFLSACPAV